MSSNPILFDLPKDWNCGICHTNTFSGDKKIIVQINPSNSRCGHIFHSTCFNFKILPPFEGKATRMYAKCCPTCNNPVQEGITRFISN